MDGFKNVAYYCTLAIVCLGNDVVQVGEVLDYAEGRQVVWAGEVTSEVKC